jgi:1-acyl-sn-glycerol-3-phosphate acyltransferase
MAAALARWHRASLEGVAGLPAGPALLVGNHGLFGFETPAFFYLLHAATGRYPVGLADRTMFGREPIRSLLARVGGVPGTPANARALLAGGELVVCYPGGAREVFKAREDRYRLAWDGARGFARLAIEAQVPVVPFAALGVDESWVHLGRPPFAARLGRYAMPLAVGLGPLPLPVSFRFRLGPPLAPPGELRHLEPFRANVRAAVERLLGDADDADDSRDAAAAVP